MCGRFALTTPADRLAGLFAADWTATDGGPRHDITPGQAIVAVRFNPATRRRSLDALGWGLIPHWTDHPGIAARLVNARSEGLADKPAFRSAFRSRRCLIPADLFYEWKDGAPPRQPFAVRPRRGGVFALAGLWEGWRAPDGAWIRTTVIITTPANPALAVLHSRMPAILDQACWAGWLGEVAVPPDRLAAMLRPCRDDDLDIHPAGPVFGRIRGEGPAAPLLPGSVGD